MAQSTTKPASTNNSFVGPLTPKPRTETPPEFTDKPWKAISINGYHRGWTLQKQWDESGKLADMDFFHILLRSQVRNLVLAATMRTGKTFVFIENVDEILMHGASHREADRRFSPLH